jgi:hypothetical protein
MTELTDALAAVVRGEHRAASRLAAFTSDEIRRVADEHGVLPLVVNQLTGGSGASGELRSTLWSEYQRRAIRDALRERDLQECVEQLRLVGVRALLLKGAHLAYTHYERPDLRPRVDTDMLIAADDRNRVRDTLTRCGYEPAGEFPGDLVMYQTSYTKRLGGGLLQVLDLHWRIANPQVFGAVISFDELAASAVRVSALGPGAMAPSPVHALIIACVHRVAHHFNSDLLIWLYDIHLLASSLAPDDWTAFVAFAHQRGVAAVSAEGLQLAEQSFHTSIPEDVRAALSAGAISATDKKTAAYLRRRRHIENIIADFRALPGWGRRLSLLREHLFPSPQYMRGIYAPASHAPLAVLYVQRAMGGARKWLRKPH